MSDNALIPFLIFKNNLNPTSQHRRLPMTKCKSTKNKMPAETDWMISDETKVRWNVWPNEIVARGEHTHANRWEMTSYAVIRKKSKEEKKKYQNRQRIHTAKLLNLSSLPSSYVCFWFFIERRCRRTIKWNKRKYTRISMPSFWLMHYPHPHLRTQSSVRHNEHDAAHILRRFTFGGKLNRIFSYR